jgi:hypothetical protein
MDRLRIFLAREAYINEMRVLQREARGHLTPSAVVLAHTIYESPVDNTWSLQTGS